MKKFDDLMKDLEEQPEKEEEITDKEIEARVDVFMRTVIDMDNRQKKFLVGLSLKLNDLFKSGCSAKQLLQTFKLESKRMIGK